jgi:glycosyltransferase involved in cell wall biosynthesis
MSSTEDYPLITVGVPTYNRPNLLPRALNALAAQSYPNLEVIVSDNHTEGDPITSIIMEYDGKFKKLIFYRQERNIESIPNFLYLLEKAKGEYFMWLTDDDEISPAYILNLYEDLQKNPNAVSAIGGWVALTNLTKRTTLTAKVFPQDNVFVRLTSFFWRADDAFFHGLHRTAAIRACKFHSFSWPNKDVALDWAYIYVLDLIFLGKVIKSNKDDAILFNHMGNEKFYFQHQGRGLIKLITFAALRRINVHLLYNKKILIRHGLIFAILFCVLSFFVLGREFFAASFWLTRAILGKMRRILFN